eukprot:453935-Prymnesium_polylepis.1
MADAHAIPMLRAVVIAARREFKLEEADALASAPPEEKEDLFKALPPKEVNDLWEAGEVAACQTCPTHQVRMLHIECMRAT